MTIEHPTQFLYTKDMAILRRSVTNESEDTYDVFHPPTGYEPKAHDFDELQNSSVSFSFMIPSADQDVDDLALGETLTQAYRGQVDHFVQGGMSVSRRRLLLCSMEQGNLREREMSTKQLFLVSQATRTVLTAIFLKTPKLRQWLIDLGNLWSETARTHRLGLLLKNRDR